MGLSLLNTTDNEGFYPAIAYSILSRGRGASNERMPKLGIRPAAFSLCFTHIALDPADQ